jgi:hypothetical protein
MLTWAAAGWLLPAAHAIGPTNQTLTNPYVFNNADPQNLMKLGTNSIIQVDGGDSSAPLGTGSVIKMEIIDGVGYLCILTADHVLNGSTVTKDFISFTNSATEGSSSMPQFPIISYARVAGNAGETVDADVAIVRVGDPTKPVYTQTLDRGLALNSVGSGIIFTEIGFGRRTGLADNQNTDPLVGVPGTYGTKRYQNNQTTRTIANFNQTYSGVNYRFHAITYTFDAIGTPNRVPGEGFGFAGDSGAPFLTSGLVNSTNLNAQGNTIFTNTIAGIDVYGPNSTADTAAGLNKGEEAGVDVGFYSKNITTACDKLFASVPEPSSWLVLATGLLGLLGYGWRRGRAARA